MASFRGAKGDTAARDRESAQQAAATVGTNRQYVYAAEKIEAEAPKLLALIRAGTLTIPQACTALKQRDQAPEAFAALEDGRIGFAEFREACRAASAPPPPSPVAPGKLVDMLDNPVPAELTPVFATIAPKMLIFSEVLEHMTHATKTWDIGPATDDLNIFAVRQRMEDALRVARESIPYCLCPRCAAPPEQVNDGLKVCPLCRGTKYLTQGIYFKLMDSIKDERLV